MYIRFEAFMMNAVKYSWATGDINSDNEMV
jgi:hypothetical protein